MGTCKKYRQNRIHCGWKHELQLPKRINKGVVSYKYLMVEIISEGTSEVEVKVEIKKYKLAT